MGCCAYGFRERGNARFCRNGSGGWSDAKGESQNGWEGLLNDLYQRGLVGQHLQLVITDGCAGLARALETVYPRVRHQRCWVHKMRNILEKVKRRDEKQVKSEALGLQWGDVDFDHKCIHIRRSAWHGKTQSTKSRTSSAPITLPDALASVLRSYKEEWKPNPDGFLFTTRNGRPPSSNKVVEYQLWPILDALNIPRCGLHAFRHSVASFVVDAGYAPEVAQQQLRHSNSRTTLQYIHLRGGLTEQATADVSNSLLDVLGRRQGKGSPYIQ